MTDTPQHVTVTTDAGEMPAHLWLPEAGSGPGLLLLQEIFGVSRYIRSRAADLAAAGYVVLAPELYWRLDEPPLDDTASDAFEQAVARVEQLDWNTTVADSVAALRQLSVRPEVRDGAGVIGFCFGGGLGFNVAALGTPDVLVSYYGSAIANLLDLAPAVTAPSLYHFGLADDYVDASTVAQIRAAVATGDGRVRFETYDGANHAFDNPDFPLHHAEAAALAWTRTLEFLAHRLPAQR